MLTLYHRIINDRIEKSIKGRRIGHTGGKGEGFALHFYHGSNVGRTSIALAHPPSEHWAWGIGVVGGCAMQGSTFFILQCGNPTLRKDHVGFILFYSVIYNSVHCT